LGAKCGQASSDEAGADGVYTIYSATTPAALYMAAILDDPWTALAIAARYPTWRTEYRSLRAVLLDWLGDMAHDVGDETARLARDHGFLMDEEPHVIALRAARPTIFNAVVPFMNHNDLEVRRSALIAAAQLLDDPELVSHRAALVEPLKDLLMKSPNKYHRVRARHTLIAWGVELAHSWSSPAPNTALTGPRRDGATRTTGCLPRRVRLCTPPFGPGWSDQPVTAVDVRHGAGFPDLLLSTREGR
jgi:hypothetical protein